MNIFKHINKTTWSPELTQKALYWACQNFPYVAYFCPQNSGYPKDGFEHLLFAGTESLPNALHQVTDGYKVGIVGYDKKNDFEDLESQNPTLLQFPKEFFFRPSLCIQIHPYGNKATLSSDFGVSLETINQTVIATANAFAEGIRIRSMTRPDEYFSNFEKIQEHIKRGDVYELNYCQAFEGTFTSMDSLRFYAALSQKSPMPFSSYLKVDHLVLVSASPERFLNKKGNILLSQPIKGTSPRGKTKEEDDQLACKLSNSEKEKAENLMIVDLMRNDLSKVGKIGSVKVEELFGIYRFHQVIQMISSVTCVLDKKLSLGDIFKATFPMGSMTGAPKIKAMELIDKYENFSRGWFSGALGYVTPSQDFDFNVVIRSVFLDMLKQTIYFAVGSAITSDALVEEEYQECLLKAQAIREVLYEAQSNSQFI
ncbi:anthranilate synthase component I family protein [Pleomorphovibrio marinus]|uniref:anthranilate synthase component I family protein n=1 Tax=Pleomorphovibrio marinus TaxID=2164132 RepID=UPI001E388D41|nr:anthranilate synthase component I family protein [Pleomorphovibrio marinus]